MRRSGQRCRAFVGNRLSAGELGLRFDAIRSIARPEHVPWADVEQVDFDRPATMYPSAGGR